MRPTLLDEADILFGKGARKKQVRSVINRGYTRNGSLPDRVRAGERVRGRWQWRGLDVLEKETGEKLKALLTRAVSRSAW